MNVGEKMELNNNEWKIELSEEFEKPYYKELMNKIENEKKSHNVFPLDEYVFNALNLTDLHDVKVVIIGQDPYHGVGQAHGLAFSVQDGVALPPSLKNIYKEIESEFGYKMVNNGNLIKWAKQGVLLLNSSLTVNENLPASHKNFGWELFVKRIVEIINNKLTHVIFLLWGSHAKEYANLIDSEKHFVLFCAHPSPLSAYNGFFGCNHFARANRILKGLNKTEIDWKIE